jgi:glycosyltransferase involved in cell wall biosynthesis
MDVAVAPYPNHADFYFSPLKVYEYMAAGLPVVASEIGQLATLIEHDRTGLLCEPGDPVALADAIERLRQQPQLRAQLGREARETMLREHSWDAVVQRIVTIADSTTLRAHEREVARS